MLLICRESTARPIRAILRLAGVHNGVSQSLLLPDNRLDCHAADDAAQVSAEDPSDECGHLGLIALEPTRRGRDGLMVVGDP